MIMTDLPPDVQRGIEQSTLPGASSIAGKTIIPVYITIICFLLLSVYV